ncbi:hypothetical protein O181_011903 [Austropuccinia psidii MF-1]|uniref:Uncharacterized protein n=1 Tax=Austropuccinia psidii MF-1 TaxID=1389203 RepID=A0A9Q3BVR6_9BASI|nr:hypothetical protein [Austropuccinia psidii MF-1]
MDPETTNRKMGMLPHDEPCSLQYSFVHDPTVTSLLNQSKVIIRPFKDGNGKRKFELGMIITISCHPWDSNSKQPTPGPSGTQWLEDLFHGKQQAISFLILAFALSELTFPPFVEPSQHYAPPIPGPSQSSDSQLPSHENNWTYSLTPPLTISSLTLHSTLYNHHRQYTCWIPPPSPATSTQLPPRTQFSPPLIPMMRLCRNSPTCDRPS